jgi:tellurite resistance protein TerC
MPDILFWHWLAFGALVVTLLALDLLVFHRDDHAASLLESAGWTVFWCSLAAAFNGLIWWWRGAEPGVQFLTGYVVEWMLSVDNVFVFAVIFRFFQVPPKYQYRVLFWGILGAILLRLLFILAGTELIRHFDWVMPLFGLFLVYTAVRLALQSDSEVHPEKNTLLRVGRRILPISRGSFGEYGSRFVVREDSRRCLTPLFLVLLVIESTDVLFAVDSVPAVFGITKDPFVVFTSNIFAILGLRSLYFLLAGAIGMFRFLHYGLSAVLALVGLGMIGEAWLGYAIPTWMKLLLIAFCLASSILASVVKRPQEADNRV